MKKSIVLLFAIASLAACDLSKLEPAQTSAFVKYFADLGDTKGVDVLELADGYLVLGNNTNQGNTAFLIKTDRNGNTIWIQPHPDLVGHGIAIGSDGYFIVGDGINGTNRSTMKLVKTDMQGTAIGSAELGNTDADYHGSALTISRDNEVVVSGIIDTIGINYTYLYGYTTDLAPAWNQVRKWGTADETREASQSIIEVELDSNPGDYYFGWTNLVNNGSANSLEKYMVRRDELTPGPSSPLLQGYEVTETIGDFGNSQLDAALVQTVSTSNGNGIAFSQVDEGGTTNPVIITPDDNFNYTAHSLVQTRDGSYVVLGSSDNHLADEVTRRDTDFYIKKVGHNGTNISDGFTLMFGNTGSETGSAIIQAEDGGYVFVGTLNDNDIDLMMLVKINSQGKLEN